jgi:hypothetical protein
VDAQKIVKYLLLDYFPKKGAGGYHTLEGIFTALLLAFFYKRFVLKKVKEQ